MPSEHRMVRVIDLKPGDCTPWYEVVDAPEPDGDEMRVLVRHFDEPQHVDYVRGPVDEELPVVVMSDDRPTD